MDVLLIMKTYGCFSALSGLAWPARDGQGWQATLPVSRRWPPAVHGRVLWWEDYPFPEVSGPVSHQRYQGNYTTANNQQISVNILNLSSMILSKVMEITQLLQETVWISWKTQKNFSSAVILMVTWVGTVTEINNLQ